MTTFKINEAIRKVIEAEFPEGLEYEVIGYEVLDNRKTPCHVVTLDFGDDEIVEFRVCNYKYQYGKDDYRVISIS